jgi:hypothetical protein
VSYAPERLDVVMLGDNNIILWNSWNGSLWSEEWEALGTNTVVKLHKTPALVSRGPKFLDLFALSLDNVLYHLAYDQGVWGPTWENLGGIEAELSPPVAVSWGSNRLDVFLTTPNSTVMHLGWTPWDSLGQLKVASATSTAGDEDNSSTTPSGSVVDVGNEGLTSGALAGIVVGCVLAGALMFGGLFWYWFRRSRSSKTQPPAPSTDTTTTVEKQRPLHGDERYELEVGEPPELETQERPELDAGDFRFPELYDRDVRH